MADKRLPDRNTSVCFERTAAAPEAQLSNFPEEDEAGVKYFRGIWPPFQVKNGTPALFDACAQLHESVNNTDLRELPQLSDRCCDRLNVALGTRSCSAMTPCGGQTSRARCSRWARAPTRAPDAAAACCSIRTTNRTGSRHASATTAGRCGCQQQVVLPCDGAGALHERHAGAPVVTTPCAMRGERIILLTRCGFAG